MDYVRIFTTAEGYLEFTKDIGKIHEENERNFKAMLEGFEKKYAHLRSNKSTKKQDEFLVPEVPKIPKKETKDKRESRASRKKEVELNKTNTVKLEPSSSLLNDADAFRRSSRIASKQSKANQSTQSITDRDEHTNSTPPKSTMSPGYPPSKIRRTNETQTKNVNVKTALEETVCTVDMKQPLSSSTPTPLSPMQITPQSVKSIRREDNNGSKSSDEENKTPVSDLNRSAKTESVKKRIAEFEKRSKAAVPSKLPIRTPEKKVLLPLNQTFSISDINKDIFTEDDSLEPRHRALRTNSKILQEQSGNVKVVKEKDAQKKKADKMQATIEENKRKREERGRKAAAQREAVEKEKLEAVMKLEKEKEAKFKLIQKQKDEKQKEENLKKKQLAAMKAAEMEERRKQEEAARLARLKEAEEEQKRVIALKQQKKYEEARLQEQAAKLKEKADKAKVLAKAEEKKKKMQQDSKPEINEYDIENILEGDSSDDEERPKKQIPSWASKKHREHPLNVQSWIPLKDVTPWFYDVRLKNPKVEELFSTQVKMRPRTSSAFWNSIVQFDESFPLH